MKRAPHYWLISFRFGDLDKEGKSCYLLSLLNLSISYFSRSFSFFSHTFHLFIFLFHSFPILFLFSLSFSLFKSALFPVSSIFVILFAKTQAERSLQTFFLCIFPSRFSMISHFLFPFCSGQSWPLILHKSWYDLQNLLFLRKNVEIFHFTPLLI